MKNLFAVASIIASSSLLCHGEVKVVFERNETDAGPAYRFKQVPPPSRNDAATKAKLTIIDGRPDSNGGEVARLHDGRVATEEDQPSAQFFFRPATDGGRVVADLGSATEIQQVNTYSWHGSTRAPQVYELFGSDGAAEGFNAEPKRDTAPASCGWTRIASVDTRPKESSVGGQYGVSVSNTSGTIGKYRYLLWDIRRTEDTDPFGNTFYTEFDVVAKNGPAPEPITKEREPITKAFALENGYEIVFDTTAAPDLTDWAHKELAPIAVEWYPKLVALLPSEGYEAPRKVSITFKDGMGGTPAYAAGARISCNADWFRRNLKGEAKGSVVHELVHVVQQYGRARRTNPNATRAPGWLVEGIPDYLRWYLYEPQSRGAEISGARIARVAFDNSYRVSANFLNWTVNTYNKELVTKLNAALRNGAYTESLWKELTGKTVQELGTEWKKHLETKANS